MKATILNICLILAACACCFDAGIHMERTEHICTSGFPRMYLRTHEEWAAVVLHPGITCDGMAKNAEITRILSNLSTIKNNQNR